MQTKDRTTISIERLINAGAESVWQAWTDPNVISKWFGSDPNGTVSNADLDVRPGGYFEVTFNDYDQTEHTCSGIYRDVQEFSKLSFSWVWKSEPGIESFVTVVLTEQDNVTKMHFEHANVWNESAHNYLQGWQNTFEKLERMLDMQRK